MDYFKAPGIFVQTNTESDKQAISPMNMNSNLVGFIGITERGEVNKPTYIRNFKEYTATFGGYNTVGMLPYSIKSFFDNGGEHCIVIRTARVKDVKPATLTIYGEGGELNFKSKTPGSWGNGISCSLWKESDANFSISLSYNGNVENYLHLSYDVNDERYFGTYINKFSKWCVVSVEGDIKAFDPVLMARFSEGDDGIANMTPRDMIGVYNNPNDNYGLASFEKYDDVTLIALPDVQIFPKMDDVLMVQKIATMFAERRKDRFVVLDVPERLVFQDIKKWTETINTRIAAGYYPNIVINNPLKTRNNNLPETISIPPSGAICGIISYTDRIYGPYMPPSGGVISSALNTSRKFTKAEEEILFASNINYLKYIRGNGVRVWGARTLDITPGSEWQHINVRRAFSRICKFLKYNTEWAVFEPNTSDLRKSLVYSVQSFLMNLFRRGYFAGKNSSDAFYVYCGEENNTPEDLDRGIITIDVGVALVRPAEFFNIRLASNKESASITFDAVH